MKGTLYIQLDERGKRLKKTTSLQCEVSIDTNGTAVAGIDRDIKALMETASVAFISANGIMIKGIIRSGNDPYPVLRYQEWWFVPSGEPPQITMRNA